MSVKKTLAVPGVFPEWATTGGTTLAPDAALQATGWAIGDKAPALVMNWLQNLYYKWIQYFLRMQISNWKLLNYTTPVTTGWGVVFHPEQGTWLMTDNSDHTWVSQTGINWDDEGELAGFSPIYGWKMDITNDYIIMCRDEGIQTRDSAGSWVLVPIATIGTANPTKGVCSQYPNSENIVVVDDEFEVYTAASVDGVWSAAATQPPSPPSGTVQSARIVYAGGSTFYLLAARIGITKIYKSLDNGANWAVTATAPSFSSKAVDMAYDPDNGVLVVVGQNSTYAKISYSLDQGDSWSTATIDYDSSASTNGGLYSVYYCGNGVWAACGVGPTSLSLVDSTKGRILVTSDLENWTWVAIDADAGVTGFSFDVRNFASNGKYLVAASKHGVCICDHNGVAE